MIATATATIKASPPVAYSYVRFSTPEQAKGDSLRRQTEATEAWCLRNGVKLDTSLNLRDLGVSAFKGKHRDDKAALSQFVRAVEDGRVARGSFLVIENLDRLSREDERTALRFWLDILDRGVNIVQLQPETVFRHERSEMTDIIRAIIELSRGHSESRIKSERVGAAWSEKKRRARKGEHLITHMLPGWVVERDGRIELVPEPAALVRRIFSMASSGYGHAAIVKKLTEEKVSAFGRSGRWCRAYIAFILKDRRALGEFQPRKVDGSKDGPPISGYFPAAVSEVEYLAARAGAAQRKKPGSINRTDKNINIFSGMMTDIATKSTYYCATRTDGGKHSRVFISTDSAEGRSASRSFPYPTFERGLLSQLAELNPADVLGSDGTTDEVHVIENELAWVRGRAAEMKTELLKGNVAAVADVLRDLERRESELVDRLEVAKTDAVVPPSVAWDAMREIMTGTASQDGAEPVRTLLGALDNSPDPVDTRLRLRTALRRVVTGIGVRFYPMGRDRFAVAKVNFGRANDNRVYFILHRPPKSNAKKRTPGRWWSRSVGRNTDIGGPFLEDPAFVMEPKFVSRLTRYAMGVDGAWRCGRPGCGCEWTPTEQPRHCPRCVCKDVSPIVASNVTTGEIP